MSEQLADPHTSGLTRTIIWVILFSIAMGFLEGAVVIYLRELYYPEGFVFPLKLMSTTNALVELFREVATIIMLLGIGMLAGRNANQRLSFFVMSFAIWDIFYYVFLWLVLDWPQSIMEWDILFLVPVLWVGPVVTPLIITVTMLLLSTVLLKSDVRLSKLEWTLFVAGSLVVILSWTLEFQQFSSTIDDPMKAVLTYVPQRFPWIIFWLGEAILCSAIFLFWRRTR
ncbi:MAG TPA: hypothetical protein VFU05_04465 [Cyclobacteriaceae bacterium]|nr:hypothetical protein [Cyclobacteriaceae bacterium]